MLVIAIMVLLFAALGGWIVMSLWNWLVPALFGWHTVTFWQAFGLLVLCRILFGNFGGRGRGHVGRSRFRRIMLERAWEGMSPGEREKFRVEMQDRCGPWSKTEPQAGQ